MTEVYEDYSMVDGIFYLPNTILPKVPSSKLQIFVESAGPDRGFSLNKCG